MKIQKEHLTEAVICRENDDALEVSQILRDTQTRHLVVLDDQDKPVGVISTVDLNNRVLAAEKDPKATKAKDIMTTGIEVVSLENDTYETAFEIMANVGTYSIPVTREGKLLGILEFNAALRLKDIGGNENGSSE